MLAQQTYGVGGPKDPNFLNENAVDDNGHPIGGFPVGLPPWDPNSPTGMALLAQLSGNMDVNNSHGPGWRFVPGQGWINGNLPDNAWVLEAYPGFANGGDHAGGMRWVGGRGAELEATGASRLYTPDQMNAPVVRELKALRAEFSDLKSAMRLGNTASLARSRDN